MKTIGDWLQPPASAINIWWFVQACVSGVHSSSLSVLQGRNLNLACRDSDVTVRIGTEFCNVTSLSQNQLTCKPPKKAPLAIGADGQPTDEQLPQVVVSDAVHRWQRRHTSPW